MKIYTNEGNPFGLKLQLLAKFAKQPVEVVNVTLNDTECKDFLVLPTLVLENGVKLFSTDAVAKYLFPDEGALRDEWLEWSTVKLAPALAQHLAVGHRANPDALPVLNMLVRKLDDRLAESPFLVGDKITSADIAVWSLLAPDGTLKGALNIEHLKAWYRKISALAAVQDVLTETPLAKLTFTSLQNSNRYGGLNHVPVHLHTSSESEKLLAETSGNLADTVTEEELNTAKRNFVQVAVPQRIEPRTVLPKSGERNVLITSALPYVNNVPHLGNIIGCVLSADIFARYSRAAGYNTLYICGTDEYGTATENKALAENLTPKQICDKYFDLHNSIYRWFGIGFDFFGRTSSLQQTEIVQEAFNDVYKNGYIFTESVEQLLCVKCDRFLADRFVEGTCPHSGCGYEDARGDQCDKCGKLVNATELIRPRCKICNTAPILRSSDQLFLDLPKVEPQLRAWMEGSEMGWTNNARVIARSWLREGLRPRCITRDLKWGIPVPLAGFEKKVFYVWFDAPYGYISMTKHYTSEYKQWWIPSNDVKVELFQFMAKDNVPFHSVIFPSSLLATNKGHTMVTNIMATEYLNYEDGKFSKSRGIGVFGNDAQETGIPADIWRFYLACARPEGQDSSFSWNDLAARNNSDLLNNLGNFVNRALVFCEKNFDGVIQAMTLTKDELVLLALINREVRAYVNSLEKAKLRDGIRHLLSISRQGNGYMQAQQPWVLLKGTDEQKARAATIIGVCANIAAILANLLFPYMPATARTLLTQLNAKQTQLNPRQPFINILLPTGHKIGKPAPLFTKLEQSFIDELKQKFGGVQDQNIDKKATLVANTSKPDTAKASLITNGTQTIAQLEEAVRLQGEKVRQLKASTKDKSVWQPEVNILLDLKKQLTVAQAAPPVTKAAVVPQASDAKVKELEQRITQQGEKVRQLKAAGDASVWKPEVDVLLQMKKELATLTGAPQPTVQGKNKKKK
ncbi:PREDICTED: methionine--tRNA ligase, cytoplasmic [Rhagoletis zephyria]|uniref:methionine--tRNA ligase, cytoplasmic n=1 Tax=Rhagoletis zephyria TaxID=28612 RepID=UPI0008119C9D|nr:PREDICTED: methionine--tRNA ligase, cytoplasmic [Rhagoletis zephyria]